MHVVVASDDLEPGDGVLIDDSVGDLDGMILFYPWNVVGIA